MPKNTRPGRWEDLGVHVLTELERLNAGQEKIVEHLGGNNLALEKNNVLLQEHMRRTEAVEEHLEILKREIEPAKAVADIQASLETLKKEIEPAKTGVAAIKLIGKIGAGIGALVGALVAAIKLWEMFHH